MPNCIISNGYKSWCGKDVENVFAFENISDAKKSALFFGEKIELCADCLSAEREVADADAREAQ